MKNFLIIFLSFSLSFGINARTMDEVMTSTIDSGDFTCSEAISIIYVLEELDRQTFCGQYQTCMDPDQLAEYIKEKSVTAAVVSFLAGYLISKELDLLFDYDKARAKAIEALDKFGERQSYHARKIMEQNSGVKDRCE